jgi:beta-N-acetylhexosaminidase
VGAIDDAGTTLMVGLAGPVPTEDERRRLSALRPGGVILFARNLETPERVADLVEVVRDAVPEPFLLAIDQEGGRVSRIAPWIGETPTAERVARAGADLAYRFGEATARCLTALGFDLDFAPVVDLCPPGTPNGIGDRSYGTDPVAVAHVAGSFLDGLQRGGIAGCLKHFPGLGDTAVDSHRELPVVRRDASRLRDIDLAPYRILGRRPAAVMVGHGNYPTLGIEPGVPATLSRAIVTGLLRGELGYDGLVVSDDLEMGAVAPLDAGGRAAVAAVEAGCDLLPYCADLDRAERARDALVGAARESRGFAVRLADAATRVRAFAARWPRSRTSPERFAAARAAVAAVTTDMTARTRNDPL